jgi:hypothetical protein
MRTSGQPHSPPCRLSPCREGISLARPIIIPSPDSASNLEGDPSDRDLNKGHRSLQTHSNLQLRLLCRIHRIHSIFKAHLGPHLSVYELSSQLRPYQHSIIAEIFAPQFAPSLFPLSSFPRRGPPRHLLIESPPTLISTTAAFHSLDTSRYFCQS